MYPTWCYLRSQIIFSVAISKSFIIRYYDLDYFNAVSNYIKCYFKNLNSQRKLDYLTFTFSFGGHEEIILLPRVINYLDLIKKKISERYNWLRWKHEFPGSREIWFFFPSLIIDTTISLWTTKITPHHCKHRIWFCPIGDFLESDVSVIFPVPTPLCH